MMPCPGGCAVVASDKFADSTFPFLDRCIEQAGHHPIVDVPQSMKVVHQLIKFVRAASYLFDSAVDDRLTPLLFGFKSHDFTSSTSIQY
jgi:hypothetical protein